MESDAKNVSLTTPAQFLPGVGSRRAEKLAKLGVRTAQDVLFLFPRNYEHPAPPMSVSELREGVEASLVGTITDAELLSRSPGRSVFAAIVENPSGAVRILFFNQPFRADQLTLQRQVMISGAPKLNGLRMEFVHPKVTIIDENDGVPSPRILPIYPLTEGIKQSELRRLTRETTGQLAELLTEVMPDSLRKDAAKALRAGGVDVGGELPELAAALRSLHLPKDEPSLRSARSRLIFQELLVMQLALAIRRRKLTTDLRAQPIASSTMLDARILNRFPFELTADQRQAIDEIRRDMARQFPMNRLLQGDVGSGKTVVAVYAMMMTVASEHQSVLMVPTEVLARQHYATLQAMLTESRVRIGLLCGSLSAAERRDVIERTGRGEVDILIGTQALLYGEIEFHKLALCVIDEQHKFGVAQRVALRSGGVDPHYLVMSATPIPRSIAMTMFGDVDSSTLRSKPPGRGGVNTYLAHDGWKDRWWQFVRERLAEGRQAFVVAPRVTGPTDPSGETNDLDDPQTGERELRTEDVASVEAVFEQLTSHQLSSYRVGLLHGRMSNDEKQATMQAFVSGKLQVLVSTTVIEVGIDVPNATVMTILGAQRFGLAQLHQLRGRVARGTHSGHVCLFTDGDDSPTEIERLRIFESTDDGFELAEADFRFRGPGDLLGRKQSGMPPLRIADLGRDIDILVVAREMAQRMIDEDPELEADEMLELRRQVLRRYGQRLDLGDVV